MFGCFGNCLPFNVVHYRVALFLDIEMFGFRVDLWSSSVFNLKVHARVSETIAINAYEYTVIGAVYFVYL